ncbi:MAG: hypothetical protein DYG96_05920 [Chlorobi bacterium CHB2]|nr:hypothetical protein [Chlorobi bacterium CHB2]
MTASSGFTMILSRQVFLLLPLALLLAGCQPTSDRAAALKGVRLVPFTMEFSRTKAPNLSIQVPFGFMVESVSEAKHDMFYVVNPNDSGNPQRGMAVIQLRPAPNPIIPDSSATGTSKGILLGEGIDWNEATLDDESPRVLQREVILEEPFPTPQPMKLQAFVVGMDSALVEQLVACVETLSRDTSGARR